MTPTATPTRVLLALIGLTLSLLFGLLIRHPEQRLRDGKLLLVGARRLLHGGNPYAQAELAAEQQTYAPGGQSVGSPDEAQLQLPATLALAVPFSLLPWKLFCWLFVIGSACCIPGIAFCCLRAIGTEPSPKALWLGSLSIAVLPATWQSLNIGQIALPIVLLVLLAAQAFRERQPGSGALFTFLALCKVTFVLPLLAFLFWKGERQTRRALLAAGVVFVVLNGVTVLKIGPAPFRAAYRQNVQDQFGPGGVNAARGAGQKARMDIESLTALAPEGTVSKAAQIGLSLLLVGALAARAWRSKWAGGWEVAALSALALLLFYHRTYDVLLLVPALFLAYRLFRDSVPGVGKWVLAATLFLCLTSTGVRNLPELILPRLGLTPPLCFRALTALLVYAALVIPDFAATFSGGERASGDALLRDEVR